MIRTIDLSYEDLAILRAVLRAYLPPDIGVWVFGSRVTGTARRYSDLDLAVRAETPICPDLLGQLQHALSESDLTIKVDILDLRTVERLFRHTIESHMIQLPLANEAS